MDDRIPHIPPHIAPLPGDTHRPKWSVMIPVYNCSKYLEKTIESVLQQDPGTEKMQIEVIDDHSTDGDVGALVERVGRGRVAYYRKEKNMGSLRNFETCINRARGHLIHILHGDDHVMDGFYREIEKLYDAHPAIGAAFTDFFYVDPAGEVLYTDGKLLNEPGILENWLHYLAVRQRIQPPAMVVKRSVYEQLGGFFGVKYGEDWEMWARIAAHFPVAHSPAYLACYRVHNDNITGQSLATGQNIKDINQVINTIMTYLPRDMRGELSRTARKNFSMYFAWMSHKLYHEHKNKVAARKQINGAIWLSFNKTTLKLGVKLYLKMFLRDWLLQRK
jgi:glycosyltransferase involved in cell wall biosynthesis